MFSAYSGLFEPIGLPNFLGLGYGQDRRQYTRSPERRDVNSLHVRTNLGELVELVE